MMSIKKCGGRERVAKHVLGGHFEKWLSLLSIFRKIDYNLAMIEWAYTIYYRHHTKLTILWLLVLFSGSQLPNVDDWLIE